MLRKSNTGRRIFGVLTVVCVANIISACSPLVASDVSEALWGGHGSRTTATQLYVPPPLTTEPISVPMADATALPSAQTQLMIGTPGATTLPPGGVISSNGVATNMTATGTMMPFAATGSNYIQPVQWSPAQQPIMQQPVFQQPAVEYEWSYSTIKDVTYEPVTVYDSRLGGYVTTYREKKTESVLPWLHRKQVVRYKPASSGVAVSTTSGLISGGAIAPVSAPLPAAASTASSFERSIVYRLFPVSTVPEVPTQPVPVQPLPPAMIPVQAAPVTTYASDAVSYPTVSRTTLTPSATTTIMPAADTLATGTLASQQPISSHQADIAPSLPGVLSPSTQMVLYPLDTKNDQSTANTPANASGNTSGNTLYSTPVSPTTSTPGSGASSGVMPGVTTFRPMGGSQTGTPTLAPQRSETVQENPPESSNAPGQSDGIVQPDRIRDSLPGTSAERSHVVESPTGITLPAPATTESNDASNDTSTGEKTTESGIPLLTPEAQPLTLEQSIRTTTGRRSLTVSPTRMSPLFE